MPTTCNCVDMDDVKIEVEELKTTPSNADGLVKLESRLAVLEGADSVHCIH